MRSNNRTLTGLLCVCLMLALPAICRAATFTVNTTSDTNVVSGDGSLRGEILAANAAGGTQTINFNISGTGPFTITLTNGVLEISTNLTIVGPTPPSSAVAVDANNASRIFVVDSGATLNLQYLTLENGMALRGGRFAFGGAIFSDGALSIANCTLTHNQAIGSLNGGGLGGGIYISGSGTLTITDSTLSSNNAIGGAIGEVPSGLGAGGAINASGISCL